MDYNTEKIIDPVPREHRLQGDRVPWDGMPSGLHRLGSVKVSGGDSHIH